jgi:hypothetical protein
MKIIFLALLLTILWYKPVKAQVAFDAVSSATFDGSVTSGNWNHTITGSNPAIVCSLSLVEVYGGVTVSTFTYNSVTLGFVAQAAPNSVNVINMYSQAAPAAGGTPHTVAYSVPNGTNVYGVCVSFTGADQTTPLGTAQTSTTISTGISSVTVPTNGLALDSIFEATGTCDTLTAGGGQTSRYNLNANCAAVQIQLAGSTRSATGSFTWSGDTGWAQGIIAVPVNPISAPAAVARRRIINQ